MDIELDVLVGHPEHDLLFVATQVARAAGLKQPANSASAFRRVHKAGQALMALIQDGCIRLEDIPADELLGLPSLKDVSLPKGLRGFSLERLMAREAMSLLQR